MRLRRTVTYTTTVYGLIVNILLLARWLLGETTAIALLMPLFPLLLLPALFLMPLTLMRRQLRLSSWLMPAVLLFIVLYGPRFMPRSSNYSGARLRIGTYNLRAQSHDLDSAVRVIQQLDTDIIALQEVSAEAAIEIQSRLEDTYPQQAFVTRDSPYYGTGIISRLPIIEEYVYPFEPNRLRLQRARFTWEQQIFTLFNFHAQPVDESWRPADIHARRDQINYLLAQAMQLAEAHLLVGDYNFNELSEDYTEVVAAYTDVYQAVGWGLGLTGPHWGNLEYSPVSPFLRSFLPAYQRFDYAFVDTHWRCISAQVWADYGGSDHQPLVVELAWAS